MKYTIISRDELIKLIKFGTIYQSINYIFDEKNRDLKIEKLLKALPYDDELGFVIIEFAYDVISSIDSIKILMKLDIKDIISIYCLSNQALNFYKTKFNPNIKFKLFENLKLIENITKYKEVEDKKKGINALSEIFKLEIKSNQDILDEKYIQELLDYEKKGYLNEEFKSFYHDMFCYERQNDFFKEDIGFLSDIRALNQMVDIRLKKETFLSGNYTNNIITHKEKNAIELKLIDIVSKYIEMINDNSNKTEEEKKETIRNIVIGAIFLKSQHLLNTKPREKNYWENFINFINEFKEKFEEETKEALWYLGAFLGYKYLYDDYYKHLDLNIFKEDSFSENNVNVLKETNPLELELEKVRNENKELKRKVQELKNANAEVCIHKETEQNLPNNASDVDNEQTKDYIPQIDELKKQEKETKPNNKISELKKKIEIIQNNESKKTEEEQSINSELTTSEQEYKNNSTKKVSEKSIEKKSKTSYTEPKLL